MLRWLLALLVLAGACAPAREAPARSGVPRRIVAVAPSVVELVWALGRGDRVVGVDTFTQYPPAAKRLPRVGGLVDPNFELLLSLRPDLVILISESLELAPRLRQAGVDALALRSDSLADLDRNIAILGERLDARPAARDLAARIHRELDAVRRATRGRPRVPMLYVFDRQPGVVRDVFAAGRRSFLGELAAIAGGKNVLDREDRGAVPVSSEVLLSSRPEVVFDATRDPAGLAPWRALPLIPAVAAGRVVASTDPVFTIPGPRVGEVARRMARALHPEVGLPPP